MKRVMIALVAGTIVSGIAAYAVSARTNPELPGQKPRQLAEAGKAKALPRTED